MRPLSSSGGVATFLRGYEKRGGGLTVRWDSEEEGEMERE
jgi:hypothetical protein